MRKKKLSFLAPLLLSGCSLPEPKAEFVVDNFRQQRLNLEDLCDTPINKKYLDFHIYLSPDQPEARKIYEERIFPLVGEFFSEQQIECNFFFESELLVPEMQPNRVGIEVYFNIESFIDRYKVLNNIDKSENNPDEMRTRKGVAVVKSNIALFDGGWRTFYVVGAARTTFPWPHEISGHEYFLEYMVIEDANTLAHETGHLLGLPHLEQCNNVFQVPEEEINIMSKEVPSNLKLHPPIGGVFTREQLLFIHSRIAGGRVYQALQDSNSFANYVYDLNSTNRLNN